MKKYSAVFLAIKKCCGSVGEIQDKNCFQAISTEADVPFNQIHLYLDTIQNIGILQYSIKEGFIKLTEYGKSKKVMFGL